MPELGLVIVVEMGVQGMVPGLQAEPEALDHMASVGVFEEVLEWIGQRSGSTVE